MLLYRIADPGRDFKLEDLPHAAPSDGSDAIAHDQKRQDQGLRAGGFGLVLIRAIADELVYNEQRNEVVFVNTGCPHVYRRPPTCFVKLTRATAI
jgi:anti-sigma regulatory factor (Ser/Thr protein kinase)